MTSVRVLILRLALATNSYRWIRVHLPQPWSIGFGQLAYLPQLVRRHAETRRVFAEERLIDQVMTGAEPLDQIGVGLSERVVEIPWVLRRLREHPGRLLDIGTAFAPLVYVRWLVRQPHAVEAADLAPTYIPGVVSRVADVRALPFDRDSFDVAVCISTLEHIGMDNAQYGVSSGGSGDLEALRELGRVAPIVLVTVPAGRDQDLGWVRQYSPARFRQLAAEAGLAVQRLDVFEHDPVLGWSASGETSIGDREYGNDAVAAAASMCVELSRP
jgi:hypothetical protein